MSDKKTIETKDPDNADIAELDAKIKTLRGHDEQDKGAGSSLQAGMEFTAPIIGGIVIGYFIDNWLDTEPVFIIILLLLGVGSGVLNIYKASKNIGGTVGFSDLHSHEKHAKTTPNNDSDKTE
ncbi:MAG: AtpZ/AtpI family protein [Micavibrio sp.]|nr:AtpZ/AtpI family protein [Micavibrio sp.]